MYNGLLEMRQIASPSISEMVRVAGEQFAFFVRAHKTPAVAPSATRPSVEAVEASMYPIIQEIIMGAIKLKTRGEFDAYRDNHLRRYVQVVLALTETGGQMLSAEQMSKKSQGSFDQAEALLHNTADLLSAPILEQSLFTIWTFKKIDGLILQIMDNLKDLNGNAAKEADRQLAGEFVFTLMLARFHFECIVASLYLDMPMSRELDGSILDGLRGAVNAYSCAKQGARLRRPKIPVVLSHTDIDDEDRALVDASMRERFPVGL
jgi:hypothetical protein